MNVKLLRKVKKHILAEPKRFYMEWFILRKGESSSPIGRSYPRCGTIGCIAGWTCLLGKGMNFNGNEWEQAIELLGITEKQATRLFSMYSAPSQFIGIYTGDGRKETAELAARRIEHFIKTKGRE